MRLAPSISPCVAGRPSVPFVGCPRRSRSTSRECLDALLRWRRVHQAVASEGQAFLRWAREPATARADGGGVIEQAVLFFLAGQAGEFGVERLGRPSPFTLEMALGRLPVWSCEFGTHPGLIANFLHHICVYMMYGDGRSVRVRLSARVFGATMIRSAASLWFEQIAGRRDSGQPAVLPLYPLRL